MELKYIVTDKDAFAIFSPTQSHADLALHMWGKPVGAGKCNIMREADSDFVNVHCYGKSTTLELSSRPEDETIINEYLKRSY